MLQQVPDPRARRGIRHGLAGIVAVALAAVVAGARSFAAIGQRAGELSGTQLADLGNCRPSAPDASTFRKSWPAWTPPPWTR
ncbi:MAG: transposase family protein [Kineosporiaceae bacterium]|nr:transposase family protein [Kineosporiaceae bacterium]